MTMIELFTTTVDAGGMDTATAGPALALLMFAVGFTLFFIVWVYTTLREKTLNSAKKVVIALGVLIVPALWVPYVAADFEYSSSALHRITKMPSPDSHSSFKITGRVAPPGPENKTVVAAVHDKFQDELDKNSGTLDKVGLGEQCDSLHSLNEDPHAVSVLCGGYLVEPVVANGLKITPVIETSADKAMYTAFSIDPHAVEVTARIEIDKE